MWRPQTPITTIWGNAKVQKHVGLQSTPAQGEQRTHPLMVSLSNHSGEWSFTLRQAQGERGISFARVSGNVFFTLGVTCLQVTYYDPQNVQYVIWTLTGY